MRLAVLLVAVLAAGCSDEPAPDLLTASPAPELTPQQSEGPALPSCDDVWVDGATLPVNYEGCMNGDVIEAMASLDCDSGAEVFVTYQDRLFAFLGGPITEAGSDSPAYGKAYEECFADQ